MGEGGLSSYNGAEARGQALPFDLLDGHGQADAPGREFPLKDALLLRLFGREARFARLW